MINSIPSLLSGIIFIFLPESPKFLMSMGRNQEALEVFQTMFKLNTGKSIEMYPVSIFYLKKINTVLSYVFSPGEEFSSRNNRSEQFKKEKKFFRKSEKWRFTN